MKKTLALIALFAASSIACSDEMRSPTASGSSSPAASSSASSRLSITTSPTSHVWNTSFTLTVIAKTGAFEQGDVIFFRNGTLPTTFVDATHLTAVVPANFAESNFTDEAVAVYTNDPHRDAVCGFQPLNPAAGPYTASPSTIALGSPDTTITISGSGFASNMGVSIDGIPLGGFTTAFTWISPTKVTVLLTAAQIAALGSGSHTLTVSNPGPDGGGPAGTSFTIH